MCSKSDFLLWLLSMNVVCFEELYHLKCLCTHVFTSSRKLNVHIKIYNRKCMTSCRGKSMFNWKCIFNDTDSRALVLVWIMSVLWLRYIHHPLEFTVEYHIKEIKFNGKWNWVHFYFHFWHLFCKIVFIHVMNRRIAISYSLQSEKKKTNPKIVFKYAESSIFSSHCLSPVCKLVSGILWRIRTIIYNGNNSLWKAHN